MAVPGGGDKAMSLDELYAQHRDAIERAVRLTCARWHVSGADADDLGAELRLILLRADGRVLRRFRANSAFGTYLFTVFNRAAGRWIRRHRIRISHEINVGEHWPAVPARPEQAPSLEASLTLVEVEDSRQMAVETALRNLALQDRTVFAMRRSGLDNRTIARQLGVSRKSVESRLYRTLQALRCQLRADSAIACPRQEQTNKQTNKPKTN
jgi:RNA polymerase sigma factor (sigma-70 family)